jgi:pimeloyl-ACP methyl ester carboxylesterase
VPTATINGTNLYYDRSGQGPTMLFVHGMCGDADAWSDQIKRLSDRFDCVAYDRRGHSRSTAGDAPLTDALHADDAAVLISHLELDPCVLVASSGGARISVDVARRYPELLRGAVFSEPPLFSLAPDAGQVLLHELRPAIEQAMAEGGPSAAVDAFFTAVCPGLWRRLDEPARDRYRANAPMLFADLQGPPLAITTAELGAIDVPALVLTGATSHPSLQAPARALAAHLPDVRSLELEDCGHVTYAEQPEAFADAVRAFADEIGARTSPGSPDDA